MPASITIEDIADLHPQCFGCSSANTRMIHPDAGWNDSGGFLIQCGNCGRVRTLQEDHVRELLTDASGRSDDEVDESKILYQVCLNYRSNDYVGTVHATYLFPERHRAQQEADTLVERYEKQFGWASAHVSPVRVVED